MKYIKNFLIFTILIFIGQYNSTSLNARDQENGAGVGFGGVAKTGLAGRAGGVGGIGEIHSPIDGPMAEKIKFMLEKEKKGSEAGGGEGIKAMIKDKIEAKIAAKIKAGGGGDGDMMEKIKAMMASK